MAGAKAPAICFETRKADVVGTRVEREGFVHLHIGTLGFGHQHLTRQIIAVVQQNVEP